ncbi:MAG: cobalt ECF transporter T component CbiQ [Planctomycetota bacterium]|jgi:cobalt/nickel transport system permease protein
MVDPSRQASSLLASSSLVRRASPVDRIDPRTRIVTAVAVSVLVAIANRFPTLGIAAATAVLAAAIANLRPLGVLKRLLPVNLFMLSLILLLPWAAEGAPMFKIGSAGYSGEGLLLALRIALKANAIVLAWIVLLGTADVTTVGHALGHLRVPEKLTHLLLFTVRYLDVLHREYLRLRAAMKMRAFRPGMNRHTYRSLGYLAGMLLVRSLDRSERIAAAMKCRGFRGRFYLLDHFHFSRRDAWFAAASLAVLALLVFLEWS